MTSPDAPKPPENPLDQVLSSTIDLMTINEQTLRNPHIENFCINLAYLLMESSRPRIPSLPRTSSREATDE